MGMLGIRRAAALDRRQKSNGSCPKPSSPAVHGTEVIVVMTAAGADIATAESGAALPPPSASSPGPRGRARQMNAAGAQAARGDALLFLHADTVLPEGRRRRLITSRPRRPVRRRRALRRALHESALAFRMMPPSADRRSRWSRISPGDQGSSSRAAFDFALGGYPDIPSWRTSSAAGRLKRLGQWRASTCATTSMKWSRTASCAPCSDVVASPLPASVG